MLHVILISGKDSLATAIVQRRREPSLPYVFAHNDTGWDLPETMAWLDRVAEYLGEPIVRVGDDLTEICREQNCLPTTWRRFCTKYAKIQPLNEWLGKSPATVYFGLRADEPERIGYVVPKRQPFYPVYPLRELGLGIADVWALCESEGVLPPTFHWVWMEARVRELLGVHAYLVDDLLPWVRASLFAWRSRSNCDRCFNARQYEHIGLSEHHPDRFEAACLLEEELCHGDGFSWVQGYRLRDLPKRAAEIKERRAVKIAAYLQDRRQGLLFDTDAPDILAVTSCGLLCGK